MYTIINLKNKIINLKNKIINLKNKINGMIFSDHLFYAKKQIV